MSVERAALLIGSARPAGESTSESLGRYLMERLEAGGASVTVHRVSHARKGAAERRLLDALDEADLFVLSTPLYVDALPYLVTSALERIAAHRAEPRPARPVGFLAIVNCGFPESSQTATALEIAHAFARHAGYAWMGGLGLGGGELIAGRPLARAGWPVRHVRRSLDLAAGALLEGRPVPDEAVQLMARPLVPTRLYTWFGDRRWRKTARGYGVKGRLHARPYDPSRIG